VSSERCKSPLPASAGLRLRLLLDASAAHAAAAGGSSQRFPATFGSKTPHGPPLSLTAPQERSWVPAARRQGEASALQRTAQVASDRQPRARRCRRRAAPAAPARLTGHHAALDRLRHLSVRPRARLLIRSRTTRSKRLGARRRQAPRLALTSCSQLRPSDGAGRPARVPYSAPARHEGRSRRAAGAARRAAACRACRRSLQAAWLQALAR